MEGLEPAYVLPDGLEDAIKNGDDDNVDELSKQVTWNKDANGYRLPTEAEWEYCARGGESHLYSGSDNIDEVAWHEDNSGNETHPVGQKKVNGFGLYDMSGNVWEWVWDSWKREYDLTTDPICVDTSITTRVRRGGSWYDYAWCTRVARRSGDNASFRDRYQGFRFLRTV